MNSPSSAVPETPINSGVSDPGYSVAATRPFYWSVRRELWENRSIYIAPLIVAGLVLFGYAISAIGLPHRRRALLLLDPAKQQALVEQPYDVAAMMLMLTAFLVGVFYCLDALHGERRDRSILFWKSLPVSDLTSVLSKAIIPLVIMPLLTFAIVVITQVFILLMSTTILLPAGLGATTWERLPFFQLSVVLIYGLVTLALWQAPFYAWLLLVSGWARRATFLWGILPVIDSPIFGKNTPAALRFGVCVKDRARGVARHAFRFPRTGSSHDRIAVTTCSGKISEQPGSLDRATLRGNIPSAVVRLRLLSGVQSELISCFIRNMSLKRIAKWSARAISLTLILAFPAGLIAYWRSTTDCDRNTAAPINPMKAIRYCEYGSPDVVKLDDVEKPVPNDDQVLIKVRASSLNALDAYMISRRLV